MSLLPLHQSLWWAYWERLRKSAMFYGALGTMVRVGSQVMLLPLVLRLPPAELAIWFVFLSLGALANLADFGFGPAVTRVYSILWAGAKDYETVGFGEPCPQGEPNLPRIRQWNRVIAHLYFWLAAGATPVIGLGGALFLLPDFQSAPHPWSMGLTWMAFLWVTGYNLATNYWGLACQGVNRVRELQVSSVWGGLAYLLVAGGFLLAGHGLKSLVAATAVRAVLSRWICRRSYLAAVPPIPGTRIPLERGLVRKLWPNAREFGIMSVGSFLVTNTSILISKKYLPIEVTASFGVTQQIGFFLVSLSTLWVSTKWPQITILRAQGRRREVGALFARRFGLMIATLVVLTIAVAVAGNPLLAWKGTQTRLLPTPALVFYLAYLVFQAFYVTFGIFTFTENTNPFFRVAISTGIATVCLSLWWTAIWGLWGLLLAPLIAEATINAWFTVRRGFQGQPLSVTQFVRVALGGKV